MGGYGIPYMSSPLDLGSIICQLDGFLITKGVACRSIYDGVYFVILLSPFHRNKENNVGNVGNVP